MPNGLKLIVILNFLVVVIIAFVLNQEEIEQKEVVTETVVETQLKYITRIEYIEIEKDYSRIDYTDKEIKTLEKLVMAEAKGESFVNQLLVASVIINRVESEDYPDTLHDVIYQDKPVWQFTPVAKDLIDKENPTLSVKNAVRLALEYDYSDGCTVFNNKSLTSSKKQQWFEEMELVYDIDNVQFRR